MADIPMTVKITPLPPEEWAAYRSLRLEALQSEPQAFHSTFSEYAGKPPFYWHERLESAGKNDGSRLLFARDGSGDLLGMVGAVIEESGEADIISMYVTSKARGQGIGRALLTTLLDGLKASGVKKATLQVNRVQENAVRLYRGFGFSVVKELEFCPGDGRRDDDYVMVKELA